MSVDLPEAIPGGWSAAIAPHTVVADGAKTLVRGGSFLTRSGKGAGVESRFPCEAAQESSLLFSVRSSKEWKLRNEREGRANE
jgi:hypothetical protein